MWYIQIFPLPQHQKSSLQGLSMTFLLPVWGHCYFKTPLQTSLLYVENLSRRIPSGVIYFVSFWHSKNSEPSAPGVTALQLLSPDFAGIFGLHPQARRSTLALEGGTNLLCLVPAMLNVCVLPPSTPANLC